MQAIRHLTVVSPAPEKRTVEPPRRKTNAEYRSREFLTELKRPSPQNRIDDPVVHALCDLVSIVNGRARYWPVLTLSGLF